MLTLFKKINNNKKKNQVVVECDDYYSDEENSEEEENEQVNAKLDVNNRLKKSTTVPTLIIVDPKLDEEFTKVLDELSFPQSKRSSIMKVSNERKSLLIKQHSTNITTTTTSAITTPITTTKIPTPTSFVQQFQTGIVSQVLLTELRITLDSQPVSWIEEFVSIGGTQLLLSILNDKHKKSKSVLVY